MILSVIRYSIIIRYNMFCCIFLAKGCFNIYFHLIHWLDWSPLGGWSVILCNSAIMQLFHPCSPASTEHLYNSCTTSAQRLWRWSNIVQILHKCFVYWVGTVLPAKTRRSANVGLVLAHRLRSWPNISSTLGQRLVFARLVRTRGGVYIIWLYIFPC